MNAKKKYFLKYTGLFFLVAAVVFAAFWTSGTTLIHQDDGWVQHFRALAWYGRWLREIVKTLFSEHKLVIPQWSYSIGYGSDTITTMSYYVMGDPLNLGAVFVPTRFMPYFYTFLMVLRLYLAGLSFSGYCWYRGQQGTSAVLAGALSYAFCGYALFGAIRHPFFLNPMIYYPLILVGIEKVMDQKSPVQLILSVALAAFSNFYFFYMLVIFTVLYVLLRLCARDRRRPLRDAALLIFRIGLYALVGVLISSALLLPTLSAFFADQRVGVDYVYDKLYDVEYYKNFLTAFVTYLHLGSWSHGGFAVPVLLAVLLLFLRKGHRQLKAAFLFCTALLMLPTAGYLLNGASYVSNRWIWVYAFVAARILVTMWEGLTSLNRRERILLPLATAGYFLLGLFLGSECRDNMNFAAGLSAVLVLALVVLSALGERRRRAIGSLPGDKGRAVGDEQAERVGEAEAAAKVGSAEGGAGAAKLGSAKGVGAAARNWSAGIVLACVAVSIAANGCFGYLPEFGSYVSNFKTFAEIPDLLPGKVDNVVAQVLPEDAEFTRFTGSSLTNNSTMLSGLHNTQYYWSISNSAISDLMEEMAVNEPILWMYTGLDDRTSLIELASCGYYACQEDEENQVPYGYEKVWSQEGGYSVYENQYTLPLGYTYDAAMTTETAAEMDPVRRQEAMLQQVQLDEIPEGLEEAQLQSSVTEPEFEISCGEGVTLEDGVFTVTKKKAKVVLSFEGTPDSETYLYFTGLRFEGKANRANIRVKTKDAQGETFSKNIACFTNRYKRYAGKTDFLVNLCYRENTRTSITLTFSAVGTYTFDTLSVLCQGMEHYEEQTQRLKEDVLENVELETNRLTGTITLDEKKVLCLSMPWSSGWKAEVDGESCELLRANTMYMALVLEPGTHEITLTYETPLLKEGVGITLIGWLVLAAIILRRRFLARA